jgi:hypothetical protein
MENIQLNFVLVAYSLVIQSEEPSGIQFEARCGTIVTVVAGLQRVIIQ